jgi:long-subunit acyl-CoA synthetase (AMP-forming)
LIEDLQACRPTLLPVAPRVLNKIYDKVRFEGYMGCHK